ncbi:MAG: chorismate synthase, partial [Nitrospirota bacterium]|nr:chorismate synthase [Nitrospirota bacterium]
VQWDRKLDARFAGALMGIQAIKGVEVGVGFRAGSVPGSKVHDEIFYAKTANKKVAASGNAFWPQTPRFYRKTNNAGGIEGGMSNGEPIILKAVMKPIPTLYKPLSSVDIDSKEPFKASVERSDVCAVPAAAVVAEAIVAFETAKAFVEKFGGDSIGEIERNYLGYLKQLREF